MAYITNYTFNNKTRLGDDNCDMSQRNIQNSSKANYMLQNYYPACPMTNAIDFATSQPYVNFTGSHSLGINGCNVDYNSSLQINDITKPKNRISLFQRPFVTVPYLGRGSSNTVLESQLQQGELANNRKTLNLLSEQSHINHRHTPMLASLRQTITNPENLVEDSASQGWVRGGIPSRELTRDT